MRGKCKFWRADSGYCFLQTDHGDLFCHISAIHGYDALVPGQLVKFSLGVSVKNGKPCAVGVELLEPIISPRVFQAEPNCDLDDATAHRQLAEQVFMRRNT